MNDDNINEKIKNSIQGLLIDNIKKTMSSPFASLFNSTYKKINKEINEVNESHPLFKKVLLQYTKNLDQNNWNNVLETLKIFSDQFRSVNLELKMPIDLILGEFKNAKYQGAFNQDAHNNKKLHIKITHNTNFEELLETLNHEYLHYLDYSNENKNEKQPSSEIPVNRECAFLRKFQKSIFYGGDISNLKNKFSILNLDAAFFKSFTKRTLEENNLLSKEININHMVVKNLNSFHEYLNTTQNFIQNNYRRNIGYNESLSYLHLLFDSIVSDRLYNTKKVFQNFFSPDDEYPLLDNKELKKAESFILPLIDFFKKEHHLTHHQIEVLLDNFSLNMLKGNFDYNDINTNVKMLEKINARNVYDLRNIYYTPSLNLFTEKPNGIWLNAIKDNYYFPYHSLTTEKLSFSGSSRAPKFISSYYDLVFNKNNHVSFPKKLERKEEEKNLEHIFHKGIVEFIHNNYIELKLSNNNQNNIFCNKALLHEKIKNLTQVDNYITIKKFQK